MSVAYFQVRLSIKPNGGQASLVAPQSLQGLDYTFVLVKEGGEEGIVRVDVADPVMLKQVEKDRDCKKLTPKQAQTLRASYPTPKTKAKYRTHPQPEDPSAGATASGAFHLDAAGKKIVETVQTVRSGFHLVDVPISEESLDNV